MENRLDTLERKEIAQALQDICVVSDIDAPEDLGAVINYMMRKFKTNLNELQAAMDFWITNESKIIKPRRLNVKFVSDVLNLYRGYENARKKPAYKNPEANYEPTPEEIEAVSIKSYKYAFEDYYYSIKTNETKLILKTLESNCDFAVSKGWVKKTWSEEDEDREREWIKTYARRYHDNLYKEEDNIYKRFQQKFVDRTDYEKCIVMSLHFRDRINKGHVPEKYQKEPIDGANL
jgi:hypothetical protein